LEQHDERRALHVESEQHASEHEQQYWVALRFHWEHHLAGRQVGENDFSKEK